jgi:hypothetical protein
MNTRAFLSVNRVNAYRSETCFGSKLQKENRFHARLYVVSYTVVLTVGRWSGLKRQYVYTKYRLNLSVDSEVEVGTQSYTQTG